MYTRPNPQIIENGISISVTTSASQKTGLKKATPYFVYNSGANPAYFNTNNETASATLSLKILAGEYSEIPVLTSRTGTLNHISTTGVTTLTLIPISI